MTKKMYRSSWNFLRDQSELLSLFKISHEILLYLQDEIEIFWRPSMMWLIASCHVKEFFSKTRHPQYSAKGEWRLLAQKLEGAIARFARDYRIWHLTTKKKRFKHSINFAQLDAFVRSKEEWTKKWTTIKKIGDLLTRATRLIQLNRKELNGAQSAFPPLLI